MAVFYTPVWPDREACHGRSVAQHEGPVGDRQDQPQVPQVQMLYNRLEIVVIFIVILRDIVKSFTL